MSFIDKLYRLGCVVDEDEIKEIMINRPKDSAIADYVTIQVDFSIKNGKLVKEPQLKHTSLDDFETMFTKKIGGTSNSYYLYPNFEFQNEKDLYKKFKASKHTFENSVLVYASEEHRELARPILEYLANYSNDKLGFKKYTKNNYFLVFTINNQTLVSLMPEIWKDYYENFVQPHIVKKIKRKAVPQLKEAFDAITYKKELCGYNPDVKFFTFDNYHDNMKVQIIDKLPLSKETAKAVKRGWMFAVEHLRFFHMGLEYMILPSIPSHDNKLYRKMVDFLRKSRSIDDIEQREKSFIRRLSEQVEAYNNNEIAVQIDIIFLNYNLTNQSVKIFATIEDLLPSRISKVASTMEKLKIIDEGSTQQTDGTYLLSLKNYFAPIELFAEVIKSKKGLENAILQERIALAKLLLGYSKITYNELLKRFEQYRQVKYSFKDNQIQKRLIDSKEKDAKVMEWIEYPNQFVEKEDKILKFFNEIEAITERRCNVR